MRRTRFRRPSARCDRGCESSSRARSGLRSKNLCDPMLPARAYDSKRIWGPPRAKIWTQSGLTIARKVSNGRSRAQESQEVRFSMNAKAILIGLLLVATAGMAVLGDPTSRDAALIKGQLAPETGPTTAPHGGAHLLLR